MKQIPEKNISEKINKIDEKKMKTKNERGDITTDTTEIQRTVGVY